jgi:hypothetical protein
MAEKVQVIQPKSEPERLTQARARQRIYDISLVLLQRIEQYALDPDADPKLLMVAARICFDRVFPTVARVHQTGTVQHNVNMPDVDWAEIHRRAIEKGREGERADSRIH